MAVIGDKTIERIKDHIGALCEAYIAQIDEAYLNAENDLKVNFTAHLTPGKAVDDIIVETGISFVAARVKDHIEDVVNERQGNLFEVLEKNPDIKSMSIDGKEVYRKEEA